MVEDANYEAASFAAGCFWELKKLSEIRWCNIHNGWIYGWTY